MVSTFEADKLQFQGVDACQLNLVEETITGSLYFRPMSQELLRLLTEGLALKNCSSIYERLFPSGYEFNTEEGLRRQIKLTTWEPIGLLHLIKIIIHS